MTSIDNRILPRGDESSRISAIFFTFEEYLFYFFIDVIPRSGPRCIPFSCMCPSEERQQGNITPVSPQAFHSHLTHSLANEKLSLSCPQSTTGDKKWSLSDVQH